MKGYSVAIGSVVERSTLNLNVTNLPLFGLCATSVDFYVYR